MFEKHSKMIFEKFRGLYDRGLQEACPVEYLLECLNMRFGEDSMKVRGGQFQIGFYPGGIGAYPELGIWIVDIFKVLVPDLAPENQNKFLIQRSDGNFYYTGYSFTTPILTRPTGVGFSAVQIGKRVYFMPLDGESNLFVYDISWTTAREAGGDPPGFFDGVPLVIQIAAVEVPIVAPDLIGIDVGFRIIGVLYETNTGYITGLYNHAGINIVGTASATSWSNITTGPPEVVKRHLIATKVLTAGWSGNPFEAEYFFIPGGTIENNTATTKPYLHWIDAELVDSADSYVDQLARIPSARRVTLYNGRLVVAAPLADRNACYISKIGEPESFDKINSILKVDPQASRGIEDVAEHRGNMYIFSDNNIQVTQDDDTNPNEWKVLTVDKSRGIQSSINPNHPSVAIGQYNHQPVAIEGQLLCYSNGGLHAFDGAFREEITWAIRDTAEGLVPTYPNVIVNPTTKSIILGDEHNSYVGDYRDSLNPDKIKWSLIQLNTFGTNFKFNTGLYKIYGDGSNLIACTWGRIFGWSRLSNTLNDEALSETGATIYAADISFRVKLPYVYPNDGWVYQFNEIVIRAESESSVSTPLMITLHNLDLTQILGAGFLDIVTNPGQLYRKWFNFKSEACSILMINSPANRSGLEIKNISLSFNPLWAKRPRAVSTL